MHMSGGESRGPRSLRFSTTWTKLCLIRSPRNVSIVYQNGVYGNFTAGAFGFPSGGKVKCKVSARRRAARPSVEARGRRLRAVPALLLPRCNVAPRASLLDSMEPPPADKLCSI
ncbi:unnamed protein product [Colias eurytheme]|nr:unnamed protein product [Colias eurytheme]